MKDGLGQTIEPGAQVVWVSGKGNYAGVKVYTVLKLTLKRVQLETNITYALRGTYVDPGDLVVVDNLLPTDKCEDEDEI